MRCVCVGLHAADGGVFGKDPLFLSFSSASPSEADTPLYALLLQELLHSFSKPSPVGCRVCIRELVSLNLPPLNMRCASVETPHSTLLPPHHRQGAADACHVCDTHVFTRGKTHTHTQACESVWGKMSVHSFKLTWACFFLLLSKSLT